MLRITRSGTATREAARAAGIAAAGTSGIPAAGKAPGFLPDERRVAGGEGDRTRILTCLAALGRDLATEHVFDGSTARLAVG